MIRVRMMCFLLYGHIHHTCAVSFNCIDPRFKPNAKGLYACEILSMASNRSAFKSGDICHVNVKIVRQTGISFLNMWWDLFNRMKCFQVEMSVNWTALGALLTGAHYLLVLCFWNDLFFLQWVKAYLLWIFCN